jgi:hypothetical protein
MSAPAPHARRAAFAAGLRRCPRAVVHPVVLTFAIAAYFSYVSGDTVGAAYLLAVGLALAWDHARRRAPRSSRAAESGRPGEPGRGPVYSHESAERRRAAMGRLLIPAVLAGAGYAAIVGLFQRFSWPATVAVAIPAAAGVLVAWRVSAGSDSEPERLSRAGVALWALVWAGASVWELTALYLQPNLDTDSYAHPTLTYLANPIFASVPGRSAVIFGWLAFGWYLARR